MAEAATQLVGARVPQWTVGDRIRKAIGKVNQDDIGAMLGKGKGTVGQWVGGVSLPSFKDMEAFCEITNVPLWWIMGHDEDPGPDGTNGIAWQRFKRQCAAQRKTWSLCGDLDLCA